MVLKLEIIMRTTLLLILCCLAGCEEFYTVNCADCQRVEPTTCQLEVQLVEATEPNILHEVTIYRGNIEDGIVLYSTSTYHSFSYNVPLHSLYTVSSSTEVNGKEYTAVDATRPGIDVITNVCEETCYWIVNNTVNLKLKYY